MIGHPQPFMIYLPGTFLTQQEPTLSIVFIMITFPEPFISELLNAQVHYYTHQGLSGL